MIRNVVEIAVMNEPAEESLPEPVRIEVVSPQRASIDVADSPRKVADSSDMKARREIIGQSGNGEKPRCDGLEIEIGRAALRICDRMGE